MLTNSTWAKELHHDYPNQRTRDHCHSWPAGHRSPGLRRNVRHQGRPDRPAPRRLHPERLSVHAWLGRWGPPSPEVLTAAPCRPTSCHRALVGRHPIGDVGAGSAYQQMCISPAGWCRRSPCAVLRRLLRSFLFSSRPWWPAWFLAAPILSTDINLSAVKWQRRLGNCLWVAIPLPTETPYGCAGWLSNWAHDMRSADLVLRLLHENRDRSDGHWGGPVSGRPRR